MKSVNGFLLLREIPHYVSSPFGYRIHPVTEEKSFHNGVDYATYGKKPPIYCPFNNGKVLRVGSDRFGALFVYIAFKDLGYVGLAYHCSKIICKVGQRLNKGDIIGAVGSTGRSTGEHLHWSWIKLNNKWNQYYNADYVDFEKFEYKEEVKELTRQEAKQIIKDVCGFADDTMDYLDSYIWRDSLLVRLAKAIKR
ncbi:M23 family metallopeptidase [Anaerovorax sp. IOR16]|uniref:M23 family metallopeptidase n=1 Tax=Anaerovorax sp. IOR16 TaxID=2773458 RepID=UPI0019D103AB|nr:M23 family metallopeptidase [Anaerovorax sp. IOR16]